MAEPDLESLRACLGAPFVETLLEGAEEVGAQRLPGNEDPVFGFVQRVLTHLDRQGRGCGLLFPKRDATTWAPLFDFCDTAGAIRVLHPGPGRGGVVADPAWIRGVDLGDPEMTYHEVSSEARRPLMLAFLAGLASLEAPGL